MKAILFAAMVLGLCCLASAQDAKADPVGTWKFGAPLVPTKLESTLVIKKDGDKLAGTITSADKVEQQLKDLKFKDGELTFSTERVQRNSKILNEYKLKVAGDKFTGKVAMDIAGEKFQSVIEG